MAIKHFLGKRQRELWYQMGWDKMMSTKTNLRIAVLADIHANSIALGAVLNDIQEQGGVDETWLLGDYVALGPDPARVLEQLSSLKNTRFVRGNSDRYITDTQIYSPSAEELKDLTPTELARHIRMASSFAWTSGALAVAGWLPWLMVLALEERMELPDGTRVLAVHAAPGTDDGDGINPTTNKECLRLLLANAQADLVLVGHTHAPFDRIIDGIRVINPGSVSNPLAPDLRASYALLYAEQDGYRVTFRNVDYDHQAVIDAMHQRLHPSKEYITRLMSGQIRPGWEK